MMASEHVRKSSKQLVRLDGLYLDVGRRLFGINAHSAIRTIHRKHALLVCLILKAEGPLVYKRNELAKMAKVIGKEKQT